MQAYQTAPVTHYSAGVNHYPLLPQEYACRPITIISNEGKSRKPLLKALVMITAPWMGTPEELHCPQKCIILKVGSGTFRLIPGCQHIRSVFCIILMQECSVSSEHVFS